MLKRIGLGILAVIVIGLIVWGAIWGYNQFNGTQAEENGAQVSSTPIVSVTPAPTPMPTVTATVTAIPTAEQTTVTATPTTAPTDIPEVTATPVTPVEVTATPVQEVTKTPATPVEVTLTPAPVVSTDVPEVTEEVVRLYANSDGYLFAFKEKDASKVTKTKNVEKPSTTVWLKNGLVYKPVAAWAKNDMPTEFTVTNVTVKNEELYTTAPEVIAKTVMTTERGKAHRLFDEAKKGELVVTIKLSVDGNTKILEVWHQEDEYALKVYGESSAPQVTPPPTQQPTATPRIPTDDPNEPTATPRIPTDDPNEPTATPRIPMDDPNEPTATPRIPMGDEDEPTATPRVSDDEIDWGFEGDDDKKDNTDDEIDWGFEDGDDENDDDDDVIDWGFE